MSEQALWKSISKALKELNDEFYFDKNNNVTRIHWQRFEDKFSRGTPDLNICLESKEAWVELKQLDRWPHRENTPVKLDLRREQALWLTRRKEAGGNVFVLAKVERKLYVFDAFFYMLSEGVKREFFIKRALFEAPTIKAAVGALIAEVKT